ncbi:MAG: 8-oxoguanine deaminase [Candidatus Marinimicrobia bacterium]|nr:8-oxoguanine deaminase [Candidatus Neomarinimicrobiota bacterium]
MQGILIRKAHTLVTMEDGARPLHGVDLLALDGRITAIGPDLEPPPEAEIRVLDASRCVVYPGFISTHHHLCQTLTRNIPRVHNAKLFDWLVDLYEVWRGLDPEAIQISTQVGLGELLLSGCTTSTDHLYLKPRSAPSAWVDIEIEAARELGIRFHPTRGSMSLGRSDGGLPPDDVVQTTEEVLRDSQRVLETYHNPAPDSLCRVGLAPCSPFSVTTDLLRESAALARSYGALLHTHLCETRDEEQFCLERFGRRPFEYMEDLGWIGPDVWFAHGIYFNPAEIARVGATRTGICHCPASNLRLGSGICPVPALLAAGARVGLGVDGSASNDASNMVREMQLTLLIHRIGTAVDAMPAETVLRLATRGGAEILQWPEIGHLAPGALADIAVFNLERIDYAGGMHDPAAALLFCGAGPRAQWTIVGGRILVENGALTGLDEARLYHEANRIAAGLVAAAEAQTGRAYLRP